MQLHPESDRLLRSIPAVIAGVSVEVFDGEAPTVEAADQVRVALPHGELVAEISDAAPAHALVSSLLETIAQRERLESDMQSMSGSAAQLMERFSMVSEALPLLSAGGSDQEIAALGAAACRRAVGVERVLYVACERGKDSCEVVVHDADDVDTEAAALLHPVHPIEGLIAEALRADGATPWQATPTGGTLTLNVDATGQLLLAGVEEGVALAAAAQLVGALAALSPTLTPPSTDALIVPVYADLAGARRVLGFTLADATLTGGLLTVQRRAGAVLPTGASAASPAALDARLALESNHTLRALHASISEPVLAPVLRR